MSVKVMALVWEMDCPAQINGIEFKPGHKYVLVAYADHADHHGKSIYPSVATIARKTGYAERSVQRLGEELGEMGVLVPDGTGPRGTNRYFIPFSKGGDKIAPLTKFQGDIPSGDIPSGDKMSPELKELKRDNLINNIHIESIWGDTKEQLKKVLKKAQFETWVADAETLGCVDDVLVVSAKNTFTRDWLVKNVKTLAQELSGMFVAFVVESELETA